MIWFVRFVWKIFTYLRNNLLCKTIVNISSVFHVWTNGVDRFISLLRLSRSIDRLILMNIGEAECSMSIVSATIDIHRSEWSMGSNERRERSSDWWTSIVSQKSSLSKISTTRILFFQSEMLFQSFFILSLWSTKTAMETVLICKEDWRNRRVRCGYLSISSWKK